MPPWSDILQYTPMWFWAIALLLLGLCIGSFLNVVIYRLPEGQSIVWPGSHCPKCEKPIAAYDNIPVLSYLILQGKCRQCQEPISLIYPAIEVLTGLIFVGALYQFGFTLTLIPNLIFISAMVALIFIDFFHQILPDEITLSGIVLALALRCFHFNLVGIDPETFTVMFGHQFWIQWLYHDRWASILNALAGMLIGGGSLYLIGVAYFRIRRFRIKTLEDLSEFLRKCVPDTLVRVRITRNGRTLHLLMEGGDYSQFSREEQEEIQFVMSDEGTKELATTSLTGVTAETYPKDEILPSAGVMVTQVPEGSWAEGYGLQAEDVITHGNMEGMGLGDVKMMYFVGAFLGWQLTFLTLFVASFMGGLIAIPRLITQGRAALRTAVPFGVMLGAGALLALFFGIEIVNKYFDLIWRLYAPQ